MIFAILVLGGIGLVFAVLLAVLNNKLKVVEDPKIEALLDVLPGINCGACGFSGCKAYARKVVEDRKIFNGCLPGGVELNAKIAKIIGVEKKTGNGVGKRVAICRCSAGDAHQKKSNSYFGPVTCSAAHITGGAVDCDFGCIGYGDCIDVCPVNAIAFMDGKIKVDLDKCIACGLCVGKCPRGLFSIINVADESVYVGCNNTDNGLGVRKVCSAGCIGCGICVKLAPEAFEVTNLLSKYNDTYNGDKSKVRLVKTKCPTKCIYDVK